MQLYIIQKVDPKNTSFTLNNQKQCNIGCKNSKYETDAV